MMENLIKTIGKNVRILREARGISQEELAFRADVHRAYIGQVERSERNLTINSLEKIASGLEVKAGALFF
jgi:transcriptional regulator with XRE-family HTH domain